VGRIREFRDLRCLVTGASSGIGRDLALLLAERGARLAVSARREDRLEEVATALRSAGAPEAVVLVEDLSEAGAGRRLADRAREALGHVDLLVNNAGFAVPGFYTRTDLDRTLDMIQVNVVAQVELTRLLLPDMVRRNVGGVLTVSSVAGFEVAPYQNAYASSKAFLLHFSVGLYQEYKHTALALTALCPGVTDTEFFEAAGYRKMTGYLKRRMPSLKVAKAGLKGLERGRMVVVPGCLNKAMVFTRRLVPGRLSAAVSRRLMIGRGLPVRDPEGSDPGVP
jgi:short-subunit dehydrogenase